MCAKGARGAAHLVPQAMLSSSAQGPCVCCRLSQGPLISARALPASVHGCFSTVRMKPDARSCSLHIKGCSSTQLPPELS